MPLDLDGGDFVLNGTALSRTGEYRNGIWLRSTDRGTARVITLLNAVEFQGSQADAWECTGLSFEVPKTSGERSFAQDDRLF